MTNKIDSYSSSDSIRSNLYSTYGKVAAFNEVMTLELGGELSKVEVFYETYGKLNKDRSNAILICHALSGDSHVAKHNEKDVPGWWDLAVGENKAIDTNKYFVICSNVLGGCRGTSGPNSINPKTNKPYGADFPTITMSDMVVVQKKLVEHLKIKQLLAVIGGSMGGQQVLLWALKFPDMLKIAVPIATAPRLSMQALAFDVIGRNAILRDPNFALGQYYDNEPPDVGLALARMLGHITYLSPQAMEEKFEADRMNPRDVSTEFEKRFSVGSYLAYQGDKFVERFDANTYITLSLAIDLFNLGRNKEELVKNLSVSKCKWLIISFSSDWLFPPEQSLELVSALVTLGQKISYSNIESSCGHDAFLLADELSSYGELISSALAHQSDFSTKNAISSQKTQYPCSSKSIFNGKRIDYDSITALIPQDSSVLDLGCGSGTLLERLRELGHSKLMGIELEEQSVIDCVRQGLSVIQADLNRGLGMFPDKSYDIVVLSHTLQTIKDVEGLTGEMLRVGQKCIVSFPNFGYFKLRKMLSDKGRAPESAGILSYKWYNSPNIRFGTLLDFEDFCTERKITIHKRVALDTESGRLVEENANLNADMAIFVISN